MATSRLRTLSICMTELKELAIKGHSAFTKHKNGKVYVKLDVWDKIEPDQFGQTVSVQLSPTQDKEQADGKPFVGSGWIIEYDPNANLTANTPDAPVISKEEGDDLPF